MIDSEIGRPEVPPSNARRQRIESRAARIGVVGLGDVGLPIAGRHAQVFKLAAPAPGGMGTD